jgi:hypothetical protein
MRGKFDATFPRPIWSSTARLTAASSAGLIQIKERELPHEGYFGYPRFS